jgi:hypothetical protein
MIPTCPSGVAKQITGTYFPASRAHFYLSRGVLFFFNRVTVSEGLSRAGPYVGRKQGTALPDMSGYRQKENSRYRRDAIHRVSATNPRSVPFVKIILTVYKILFNLPLFRYEEKIHLPNELNGRSLYDTGGISEQVLLSEGWRLCGCHGYGAVAESQRS